MTSQIWRSGLLRPLGAFAERYQLATLPFHSHQVLGAFAVYESIFLLGGPLISRLVARKRYEQLSKKTRVNWNIRIVSFIQSIFVSASALYVIFQDFRRPSMSRNQRLWAYSPEYGRVQAFAAGYFLWDVLVSTQYFGILGPTSLAHAVSALVVTILGFRPFANYYGVNFVLYELSTPFLNIHWLLDKVNMTGTTLQLCNGLCLMGSFFGCRLVWGSFQTWKLSTDILSAWKANRSGECFTPLHVLRDGILQAPPLQGKGGTGCLYEFPRTLLFTYLVSNAILSLLNFYWFGLMVKALKKRFSKSGTSEEYTSETKAKPKE